MNVRPKRKRIQDPAFDVPIILVVEDDWDNLLLISHVLIYFKCNFITATKGQDALDLATKYEIDLVLLNLVLPDINGFEVIDRFKQNLATQSMPIIAISGLVRTQERDRAAAAGCNDYLTKPYLIDDLYQKIRQHLPSSRKSKTWTQIISLISFSSWRSLKLLCS